jgi:hypothetical protein
MISLLKDDEDEFSLFCKSLVPKLQKISGINRRSYLRLQQIINSSVNNAEMDLLDE